MRQEIEKLESVAQWMDSRFVLPGTSIRFGLDSVIGLIPGVGDTLTFVTTAYFLGKAHRYKLPWQIKAQILWNGFLDWLIGLVPLIGDIFDIGWKSNMRNVELLKTHLQSTH